MCGEGQSLVYQNGQWECSENSGQMCGENQVLLWQNGSWMCSDLSGLPTNCTDGQTLFRRNDSWECENSTAIPVCPNNGDVAEWRDNSWQCSSSAGLGETNCGNGNFPVRRDNSWICSSSTDVNIGIGTNSPGTLLEVNGDAHVKSNLTVDNDLTVSGTIFGTVMDPSTRRLKKNIRPLHNAIETIKKLNGVSYKWKESGRSDIGVIAEEVDKVLPEVVGHNEKGQAVGVHYNRLTSVLIEAVKAQQSQLDRQQKQIAEQQKRIDQLLNQRP
jgi:hypothetical protein